jgi:hypothetical protein
VGFGRRYRKASAACRSWAARLRIGTRSAQEKPFDRPNRVRGQRGVSDPVPGSAASAKRISAESEREPVFSMTAARWFSTKRWLMPKKVVGLSLCNARV